MCSDLKFARYSSVVLWIMDLMAAAGGFIGDNWSMISPIIYGVVAALGFYMLALLAINTIQAISKGIHFAMAIAEMMLAAATGSSEYCSSEWIERVNACLSCIVDYYTYYCSYCHYFCRMQRDCKNNRNSKFRIQPYYGRPECGDTVF